MANEKRIHPVGGGDPGGLCDARATPGPRSLRPKAHHPDPALALEAYPNTGAFLQCVPFARTVSGLDLRGDAWTWWDKAANHYPRGHQPKIGSVLVFRQTSKLRRGHVCVVAEIAGPREILVTHANWGHEGDTRGVIHERQPAIDVSPDNDWSEVRLMNRIGTYGHVYPTYGFIHQPSAPERKE
ncbi:MAG: CHAP domain-containing protein, partial [Alphaproteobacteria bacterium]|nr:CHAP domain-containing protein [Alphaproteobacteria bacterium]